MQFLFKNVSVYWKYGDTRNVYSFTDASSSLQLNENCTNTNFCLYYVSPVIKMDGVDIIILGESEKWVPMSVQRVPLIITTNDSIILYVNGAINETVVFNFFINYSPINVTCQFKTSNQLKITYNLATLSCY